MSQLKTRGTAHIRFSEGFGLHARVLLSDAVGGVLFEIGDEQHQFALTVKQDSNGDLLLKLKGAEDHLVAGPIAKRKFLGRWQYLRAELFADGQGVTTLELQIGDQEKAATHRLKLPPEVDAHMSVGSDLSGGHAAGFKVEQIAVYTRKLSHAERQVLRRFLEGGDGARP